MSNHFALSLEAPPENSIALFASASLDTAAAGLCCGARCRSLCAPSSGQHPDRPRIRLPPSNRELGVTLKVMVSVTWKNLRCLIGWPLGLSYFRDSQPFLLPTSRFPLACLASLSWPGRGRRAPYGDRAAFYAALDSPHQCGCFSLHPNFHSGSSADPPAGLCFLQFSHSNWRNRNPFRFYWTWAALGLAMLAKGLVALFFFFLAVPYLLFTGHWRFSVNSASASVCCCSLSIAAPWHHSRRAAQSGCG